MALAALLFLAFVLWQQQRYQAYTRDFATVGDEAAHYVTGLCVRDFIVNGDWTSPMKWARNYYNHYPKVALGHWPPIYYLVQTAWTLVGGVSQTSIMLLQAFLAVVSALLAFQVMRRYAGVPVAIMLSLSFLVGETSVFAYSSVEAEPIVSIGFTWSAILWARYWRSPSWKASWLYWAAVILTVLAKVNGLALFLVPGLCVLLSWRWRVLRLPSLWIPGGLSGLICLGYNLATLPMQVGGGVSLEPSLKAYLRSNTHNLIWSMQIAGPLAAAFFVVGLGLILRRSLPPEWQAMALASWAVWLASHIFHSCVAPTDEARHMLLAVPCLMIASSLAIGYTTRVHQRGRWAVAATLAVWVVLALPAALPAPPSGANDLASYLVSQSRWKDATILVSSPGHGEGALIAAIAAREPRPTHVIKRATKVLATSQWSGLDLRLNFSSDVDEQRALDREGVRLLVIDEQPHVRLSMMGKLSAELRLLPTRHSDLWREVWPLPGRRSTYRVFERQGVH